MALAGTVTRVAQALMESAPQGRLLREGQRTAGRHWEGWWARAGANGRVYAARILWETPNQLWNRH